MFAEPLPEQTNQKQAKEMFLDGQNWAQLDAFWRYSRFLAPIWNMGKG